MARMKPTEFVRAVNKVSRTMGNAIATSMKEMNKDAFSIAKSTTAWMDSGKSGTRASIEEAPLIRKRHKYFTGLRAAGAAAYLEYGTTRKSGRVHTTPRPFIGPAIDEGYRKLEVELERALKIGFTKAGLT